MLDEKGWKQLSCKACGGGVPVSVSCTGLTAGMCVILCLFPLYLAHTLMPAAYHSSTVGGLKYIMTTYIIAS